MFELSQFVYRPQINHCDLLIQLGIEYLPADVDRDPDIPSFMRQAISCSL